MKIFLAGLSNETNTFCPIPTAREDFMVQRGRDALAGRVDHVSMDLSQLWGAQARAAGHEFVFSLNVWAQPTGIVIKSAYEGFRDEILTDLRAAGPVDVVLLMMHGAMVAQGYDDCEEDLVHRVRQIVGPKTIIGAEFDLHCHLREDLLADLDVLVIFKEYPHVDINDRARELFNLCVDAAAGKTKPTMALFDCRMVGMYPTSKGPMRKFVDDMMAAEKRPGVLSISMGHGFHFADVPHVGAKMLVVTDNDPALAKEVAREFGLRVYKLRREIGFDSMSVPMEQALTRALASKQKPMVVADQSDNSGGGAPGDSTYVLRWLLDNKAQNVALAILHDPEVVKIAKKAGEGATLPVRLGGKLGPTSGDPLDIEVTVVALRENYVHDLPQRSGPGLAHPVGDVALLRCGTIDIVVGSHRCQCFSPVVFSDLGIDPRSKQVLIPKSYQHFYEAFAPIAAEVIYMAAKGAVPPDPRLISYKRLDTSGMYPWVADPLKAD